jgi:enediyne polyketide synthase
MKTGIALVGMACRYPDARSPGELWENVLAQRRAFRRLPSQRLRAEDYVSGDRNAPDRTYVAQGAVLEGYEFDRARFRVPGSTYRSTDLAHWLALEVANDVLADAGFPEGKDLPRDTTGVLVGNTLTGEFSRANLMRLRWPYVRRVVGAALAGENWPEDRRRSFLSQLESTYKAPFPPIGEETLAGGLSNTIAGRICNHFDLHGGGYTVDGACASSLLAVAQACSSLVAGDLDVALAGGVDLSLDPFEIVGFAKIGALAAEQMYVYDKRSAGFWPGEGCGLVVLMRYEDAVAQGRRVYAVIRGWGVSSDGRGGITRPEAEGQWLAIQRAYRRAGYGIDTVSYFEGHGTGTSVGDATELGVLSRAIREAIGDAPQCSGKEPAVIGTIKANIGHTKAAAGVAGLIKAAMALREQVLPPTTGCQEPHDELAKEPRVLRVLGKAAPWRDGGERRAGVSAMGFGGINTHLTLESGEKDPRRGLGPHVATTAASAQDAELILLVGDDRAALVQQVEHLLTFAAELSWSELTDLAVQSQRTTKAGPIRAAVIASGPGQFAERLGVLRSWLTEGVNVRLDIRAGVLIASGRVPPRVGLLFPGQASPVRFDGGAAALRFPAVQEIYDRVHLRAGDDPKATEIAQPAIALASVAGVRLLEQLGISAEVAIGHSVGELTAWHWARVFDEAGLFRIVTARGEAMRAWGEPNGAMASIGADRDETESLLNEGSPPNGGPLVIAGFNSRRQTVVAGSIEAVRSAIRRAESRGLRATPLSVSHAFHSPMMKKAAAAWAEELAKEHFDVPQRCVISTITGKALEPADDLRRLLVDQLTRPVRFVEACAVADPGVDLWIETGPGHVLTGLVADQADTPVVSLDIGSPSLKGVLEVVGCAFVLGAPVKRSALYENRFSRPFNLDWQPRFFVNPCELAPQVGAINNGEDSGSEPQGDQPRDHQGNTGTDICPPEASPLQVLRELVAKHLELSIDSIREDSHLLTDLHMNSIAIGQLVGEAVRRLGLPPPRNPTRYATSTVGQIARALEELKRSGSTAATPTTAEIPQGIDAWIRAFTIEWISQSLSGVKSAVPIRTGPWQVLGPGEHALVEKLRNAFARVEWGGGVVVVLPAEPNRDYIGLLLDGAHQALARSGEARFVVVHQGGAPAGFAKTLYLEAPHITPCVIDIPSDHPDAVRWVVDETMAAEGYVEARYNRSGLRTVPVLKVLPLREETSKLPLGTDDVLLVTGGGKGIAAECALDLARRTGVRLVLMGRSTPGSDAELQANLRRMAEAGVRLTYCSADVTDAAAVRSAIREVSAEIGPITGLIHGAGANVPQLIASLNEAACLRTFAPKVGGLHNVLAAIDPKQLRLLVTFGSIIGRTGLGGEADYALANGWLSELTGRFASEHPHCRCLAVEWSVWSGVGMGQRLGRVEMLEREGITSISPDQGVSILRRLIGQPLPSVPVVVAGRFNKPPTVQFEQRSLPPGRFLESTSVHYPGVELVVNVGLSRETDLYLEDHTFQKQHLFPAVMGLEAMTQAAMALMNTDRLPILEQVRFDRPVVVPPTGVRNVRLAALVQPSGAVEVVLRSEETGFQTDHFRATLRKTDPGPGKDQQPAHAMVREKWLKKNGHVPLDTDGDLYGRLLFHRGRFRRLRGYRRLRATECLAEIAFQDHVRWFSPQLPMALSLGDPGMRDAAIHAIQACIPHVRLLPTAVERIVPARLDPHGGAMVHAHERYHNGDEFVYDLRIISGDGRVLETWEGLHLKKVEPLPQRDPWAVGLLGPYVERRLQELIPHSHSRVAVAVLNGKGFREPSSSDPIVQDAVGITPPVHRRPDGKPEAAHGPNISVAHAGRLKLAVAGADPVGCDLEPVSHRSPTVWRDLLGPERFELAQYISRNAREDFDAAATRAWSTMECLQKAGEMTSVPLLYDSRQTDGWVVLRAGRHRVATWVVKTQAVSEPVALAVLVPGESPEQPPRRGYHYRHVVGFEETNVVGNVYYTNFLIWQGRCREMFLRDNVPEIAMQIGNGLRLVTTRCHCEYLVELRAFDEVEVRMYLDGMRDNCIDLAYEYWRCNGDERQLVARGEQQIACTLADGTRAIPEPLRAALQHYAS